MADNVDLPGSDGLGARVATDECTIDGVTVQVQRIKPVFGTDGNATDVSSSNPLPVTVSGITGTVALPTGAATAANQTTALAHLAAIETAVEGTLAVSAASLPLPSGAATAVKQPALGTAGSPSADVITVQGHASGTALKVDGSAVTQPVSAASMPLPSGAATSANQSTAITHLAAIETAVEGTLTVGTHAVTQSGTWNVTNISGTVSLPTGAATAAKQPALGTAGSASADVITVQGITSMTPLLVNGSGVTQPVSGTVTANAGTNLNTSALALESGGNLAAAATSLGLLDNAVSGNELQVDIVAALPAGTNNIGDVDVLSVPAPLSTTGNGSAATALRVTVANDSTGTVAVTNTGTFATQASGSVAHDAADSGNPVKVGFQATNALPTAVANGDRVNGVADLFGRQLVGFIDPAMHVWKSFNATTTQTGQAIWTPASGKRIAISSIVISAYGTTAGRVLVWFGSGADTTYTAGTDQLVLPFNAAPGDSSKPGISFTPTVPIYCTTADHVLRVTTDAAISIDVIVNGWEW